MVLGNCISSNYNGYSQLCPTNTGGTLYFPDGAKVKFISAGNGFTCIITSTTGPDAGN